GAELFELGRHVGSAPGDAGGPYCRASPVALPCWLQPVRLWRARATLRPVTREDTHMAESEKRIALLIDADNAPASKIDAILNEVARHGVVNVRRAYGNWKSQSLAGWEKVLHEYAIRP